MNFQQSKDIGNSWEAYIANELLAGRCPIWYPQQTEEECYGDFKSYQADLLTFVDDKWQAIEVKSRSESFQSVKEAFPYPLVGIGRTAHWDAIKFPVFAVIVVSQVTGAWEAINYEKTRPYWQIRQLDDRAYVVPKSLFKPASLLIQRLNRQVLSLPELFRLQNTRQKD